MKKILLMFAVLLLGLSVHNSLQAQDRTITGKVVSADDGASLPGVNVIVKGTTVGTTTTADGRYSIEVPANATLVFSFIGLTSQEVAVGNRSVVDVRLESDLQTLSEVVVTGVSVGTSTKKLGFAVGKIDAKQLEEVPGVDPANALRAKVPGVRIVSPSGLPGSAPAIRLRGSNSIGGLQSPLIIVDGTITNGSLADIDMQAVESIEIIKGAAAASLYGSLAGNGVVQIITKRGANQEGTTRVTVRNEVGQQQLFRKVPLATHHNFKVVNGSYRDAATGVPNSPDPADDIIDNPYDRLIDQQDELFNENIFMTNFISIGSTQAKTNFLTSFENISQGGVIDGLPDYKRRNVRLNIDNQVTSRFKLSLSSLYSNSSGPNATEQGQGNNVFFGAFLVEPDFDLRQPNDDGTPFRADIRSASNGTNPLYQLSMRKFKINRERILGNFKLSYDIAPWWKVDGQYSLDKTNGEFENYVPKGTLGALPSDPPSPGSLFKSSFSDRASIVQLRSLFSKNFGEMNTGLTLGYMYEDYLDQGNNTSGSNFYASGIPTLGNLDPTTLSTGSYSQTTKAENLTANLVLDFRDRYILDAVVRRDGVSLFGADVRYQTYYRGSLAYRLSEDIKIPGVQELKLRGSYGTSGQRPPWEAQYETFSSTSAGIRRINAGNSNIKPSRVGELELGLNASFLNRFTYEFSYAKTRAEDQYLLIPLSAAAGAQFQWQNAGTMESSTIEMGLGAVILESENFSWDVNMNFDRITQQITELNRAPFTRGQDFGTALNIFQVQAGLPFGTMYGNTLATSLDQLTVVDGIVKNVAGNLTADAFTVNSDGYVIVAGTEYTNAEIPVYLVDENGNKTVGPIGDGTPDFNVGFSTNLRYKAFSLYGLVDWQQGGDVYNYTKQLLYFNERHGDLDQSGRPEGQRKWSPYYSQHLYNAANPSSYFVEDGSFVKVRELSLTYDLANAVVNKLGAVSKILYDAKISIIGRNLFTFTGYSGFDPEVAVRAGNSNPTNFRVDEFAYPNFRTYSVALQLRF